MSPFPTGPLPRAIGPYHLIEKIGAGGMATVYRARHAEDGESVAIKTLALHLEGQPAARARFRREAALLFRLRHPAILPVLDYGEDGDIPYVVMPLRAGGTLADRLSGAPLALDPVAALTRQLAGAIDYAHAQGVIHRDIKPGNVLFDDDGAPALADFGIATVLGEAAPDDPQAGDFVGTAAYASPEQCLGEPLSPASDLYSLAAMVFELLTGRRPFEGPSALAVIGQHLDAPPPDPLAIHPALPAAIRPVLARALAKSSAARYPSAAAFSDALESALRETDTPQEAPASAHAAPPANAPDPAEELSVEPNPADDEDAPIDLPALLDAPSGDAPERPRPRLPRCPLAPLGRASHAGSAGVSTPRSRCRSWGWRWPRW